MSTTLVSSVGKCQKVYAKEKNETSIWQLEQKQTIIVMNEESGES